jgi:hypothetical protein
MMRYIAAILVAAILVAALFGGHWLISKYMESMVQDARNQLGVGPDDDVDVKINISRPLEVALVLDELLYSLRFVLIPIIFATFLVVAHLARGLATRPKPGGPFRGR